MSFPPSSPRLVHRRYSLGVLGLLKQESALGRLDPYVLRAPVEVFYEAISREMDTCLVALHSQDEVDKRRAAWRVADRINSYEVGELPTFPFVIGGEHRLTSALGRATEAAPVNTTADAWNKALHLLRTSGHPGLAIVEDCALAVLGLNGSFGHIKAFSDARLPGFVAFGVHNPPGVISEQLLHESVHTLLWSYLQVNASAAETLYSLYGTYSTFVKRGRSAVRVLHGALSYGAVGSFWEAIRNAGLAGPALSTTDSQGLLLVNRRIDKLRDRVAASLCALSNVCRQNEVAELASAMKLSWCLDSVPADLLCKRSFEAQLKVIRSAGIDDISKAEILLAVSGEKQSRTVLPVDGLGFLEAFGCAGGMYMIGRQAVRSAADDQCAGFSNVSSSSHPLDCDETGLDAFVYFGEDLDAIAETARLDEINAAGSLLGIPDCCQEFFTSNWEEVRHQGGDLFSYLLSQQSPVSFGHAECNAAAMYIRKGLCWHFPCSLRCENTRSVSTRRARRLAEVDCVLGERLKGKAQGVLLWSHIDGYCFLEGADLDIVIPSSTMWFHGGNFYQLGVVECSPRNWVSQATDKECRRAVRFD